MPEANPLEQLVAAWYVNWTADRPGHSLAMRKCAEQLDAAKESIARWYRREGLEEAAQVIDDCNREGPYQAIDGARRIRALAEENK